MHARLRQLAILIFALACVLICVVAALLLSRLALARTAATYQAVYSETVHVRHVLVVSAGGSASTYTHTWLRNALAEMRAGACACEDGPPCNALVLMNSVDDVDDLKHGLPDDALFASLARQRAAAVRRAFPKSAPRVTWDARVIYVVAPLPVIVASHLMHGRCGYMQSRMCACVRSGTCGMRIAGPAREAGDGRQGKAEYQRALDKHLMEPAIWLTDEAAEPALSSWLHRLACAHTHTHTCDALLKDSCVLPADRNASAMDRIAGAEPLGILAHLLAWLRIGASHARVCVRVIAAHAMDPGKCERMCGFVCSRSTACNCSGFHWAWRPPRNVTDWLSVSASPRTHTLVRALLDEYARLPQPVDIVRALGGAFLFEA